MKYPGDSLMRAVTSLSKSARQGTGRGTRAKNRQVTNSQFRAAKRFKTTRLCGNLDKFCSHVKNIIKVPKTKKCSVARSVDWGEVSVGVEKVITTGETSGSRLWIWKQQLGTGLLLCPQLTSEDTL